MKKLLFLLLPAMILFSCTGGKLAGPPTVSNQGTWVPVKDSTCKIVSNQLEYLDTSVAVIPYFSQKLKIASHQGGLAVCAIFLVLGVGLLIYGFIRTFSAQSNDWTNLAWPLAAIVCLMISFGSVEWASGKEVTMPKTTYDSIINNHGDLKAYLDTQILQ